MKNRLIDSLKIAALIPYILIGATLIGAFAFLIPVWVIVYIITGWNYYEEIIYIYTDNLPLP